jgi:hypothetical protein
MSKLCLAFGVLLLCVFASLAAAQPAPDLAAAHKACTDAMNGDPEFAKSILATVDKQLDVQTLAAHQEAQDHIVRNEKSVVLAYAAMWVIAAGFLIFMWRRQGALRAEIGQLRRELEAAGKEAK